MIIDCAHYQDGRRTDEKGVPLQEVVPQPKPSGFTHCDARRLTSSPAVHVAAQVTQGPHRLTPSGSRT
jgi:hypothetical protein